MEEASAPPSTSIIFGAKLSDVLPLKTAISEIGRAPFIENSSQCPLLVFPPLDSHTELLDALVPRLALAWSS
jgi:hypothetical protein